MGMVPLLAYNYMTGVVWTQAVADLFPCISPESVVLMDDNDDTLGMYMAQTPFCTAHPMIFMEYL